MLEFKDLYFDNVATTGALVKISLIFNLAKYPRNCPYHISLLGLQAALTIQQVLGIRNGLREDRQFIDGAPTL